jgi:hypothetical protein
MSPRRVFAVLTSAALAAGAAAALAPAPASADSGDTTITVFLKAPNPTGLAQLADSHGLSRAQRLSALSTLVPSAATHQQIAAQLRSTGYSVTSETAWSITATGPASTTTSLFGTRPTATPNSSARRFRAATGALPRVPAALSSDVAAVFPTNTGPQVYHHASLTGSAFRNAYAPAKTTPSTGTKNSPATIATVQFANFFDTTYSPGDFRRSTRANDLTQYALNHGLLDPVSTHQYRAVKVGRGPSACDDGAGGENFGCPGGGDIEVNLDQESILSTAPSAKQQAYFGPNTNAGFNAAFAAVYDDAVANKYATAPNSHIVALSSSWGECESLTATSGIKTLEPILQSLVAAGVTVFSAAGDDGIYDCGLDPNDNTADVDYPGSSPSVVSVGGSFLTAPSNAPNTGSNWSESAWSCSGPYNCQGQYGNGGSGGGQSGEAYVRGMSDSFAGFAAPAWQTAAIGDAPFKNNPKRLVPDIAADGSWRTGFAIYTSDIGQSGCNCATPVIGGTSLSSPISAALLTNALGDVGRTRGVGDIHGALYSAYARTLALKNTDPRKAIRDITAGQNGAKADRGSDPSVLAQRGYDTVSGVGAVYWAAVMPYILSTKTPVVTSAKFTEPHPYGSQWRSLAGSWTVSHGSDPRLLAQTHVVLQRLGGGGTSSYIWARSHTWTGLLPGSTYRLSVQARDVSKRQSAATTRLVRVPKDDSWFSYGSKWLRVSRPGDIGGTHLNTYTRGAYATATGYGSGYSLRVVVGPDGGRLAVSAGGTRVAVFNLHAASRTTKLFTIPTRMKGRMSRTFTFTDLDNKRVSLDALWVTF